MREVQPSNALSPMLITLSGTTRLRKEVQPSNAQSQIIFVSFLIESFHQVLLRSDFFLLLCYMSSLDFIVIASLKFSCIVDVAHISIH